MTEAAGYDQLAELEARHAALRQAARSRGAEPGDVLDAAFTELEGAIDLLRAAGAPPGELGRRAPAESQPAGADSAERSLLRAMFAEAPVPLLLLTREGTVQRVNRSAGDLIGAKPGYATGRPFTAFVALPSRPAVNSQLTAVARTGKQRRIRCSLIAADGLVPCELVIGRIGVRGNREEADPLLISVRDADARPPAAEGRAARVAALPMAALPTAALPRTAPRPESPSYLPCRPSPAALTSSRRWPGCCSRTRASASPGPCSGARA